MMSSQLGKWKDITIYSRGDTERVPRSFVIDLGNERLVVTRMVHLGGWFTETRYSMPLTSLKSEAIADAKKEALNLLLERCKSTVEAITNLIATT